MRKQVECFFDVGSPASYLAWTQLPDIAARHGATIRWRPMLLGAVFKATGNSSPVAVPAKSVYVRRDMGRYAARYGVTLNFNPHFPINTLVLMRGAAGYIETPRFDDYLRAVFQALWIDGVDLGQPTEMVRVLSAAGFDPTELERRVNDPAVKDALRATTEEAVERGVFGAPTMFVGDAMFFGQDRLDWVDAALADS